MLGATPPPYDLSELKEEVAVIHKKPPAMGFRVLPALPPPYKKEDDNLNWVRWSSGINIPTDAVLAGTDTDLSNLYVGRAFHNGDLLPAKVNPSKQCAYISYHGQEILKTDV